MSRTFVDNVLPEACELPEALREALLSESGLQHISRLVTIGELALCFSHEVKSPLSVLLGSAYMMGQSLAKDDPVRIQLDDIMRSAMRMKGMTESILDFGRKRKTAKERCAIKDLVEDARSFVDPYFEEFHKPPIEVRVNVSSRCPSIAVDRWQMIHVLVNLLNNAAYAMAQSRTRLIEISAQRRDRNTVSISVSDTGGGIAPEVADRVFGPFFTTKGEHGNGLGLYIVRQTVERHGGTITLQAGEAGTVFTICLPIH
jgi:two-component system, NtrC family, sensor kinase